MRLVVAAHQTWGVLCLEELMRSPWKVAAVITYPDAFDLQAGPYHEVWYQSVKECARTYGIPLYQPDDINSSDVLATVRKFAPDLIVNIAYGQIYREQLIALPRFGVINLHGSLLPNYRGVAPIASALMNGASSVGVTVHYISEQVDEGDIILQREVPISEEDHAMEVFEKTWHLYPELLTESISGIEAGQFDRSHKQKGFGSYYPKRCRQQELIDWDRPTTQLYNFIRALSYPFRGAFTYFDSLDLIIWRAARIECPDHLGIPGQIVGVSDIGVIVKTGDSVIEVREVELAGRGKRPATAVFGRRDIGKRFGLDYDEEFRSLKRRVMELERLLETAPGRLNASGD